MKAKDCGLLFVLVFLPLILPGAGVKARFDPASPSVGPFPTDALTVSDPAQKTGLRINLPMPDCQAEASTCEELKQVNLLDGFSIEPRLRVRFSAPINPDTLRAGVFLVWLDDLTKEEWGLQPTGHVTPINAVMYDPATNTAYAEPDETLSQHRQYTLVVTDAVRDRNGDPVEPDPAFTACAAEKSGYCGKLSAALARLQTEPRRVVAASVFTTLSPTAWLEKARAAIQTAPISFQRAKPKSVFNLADLSSIAYHAQTGFSPKTFSDFRLSPIPGEAVGQIAFGTFVSPRFLNDGGLIDAPTGAGVTLPTAAEEIAVCVWLPKTPAPPGGYPVVIVGQGANSWHIRNSSFIAAALAERGMASVAINYPAQGYGPESTVILTDKSGAATEVPAAGRASAVASAVPGITLMRDSLFRQTVVDMMQLIRVIKAGADLNGDGINDLNGNRVYFVGMSVGAMIGVMLHAVEPDLRAAVLSDGAGTLVDQSRWTKSAITLGQMSAHKPSLFNAGNSFEASWALRYQDVKLIEAPGAIAVQEWFERNEWVSLPGDPLAYAPHLCSSTLPGVPIKPVLFQMEWADRTAPNPAGTNLIHAANLRESTSVYRHDLARAIAPNLPADPHMIFYNPPATDQARAIWTAGQKQIAEFLAGDGARILDINDIVRPMFGKDLFEIPAWLPEVMNY